MRLGHYLLLLLPFLGFIYKDDFPSVRVSIKNISKCHKKVICRFQKCLANRALKEASDGNSTMFSGERQAGCHSFCHSFTVLGNNENLW